MRGNYTRDRDGNTYYDTSMLCDRCSGSNPTHALDGDQLCYACYVQLTS